MNEELIYLIQNILSIHSLQCSGLSREVKDNICKLLFSLMDSLDYNTLLQHISTNDILCCYSQKSLKELQKCKDDVYLCCSKNNFCYNAQGMIFTENYKYTYRFKLKPNTYGIDLNSFFAGNCKIKKKDYNKYIYKGNYHSNENEVIIRLKDIGEIEEVNNMNKVETKE